MIPSVQTPTRLDVKAKVQPTRTRWEYWILSATDSDDTLNALGAEGWDLVACVPYSGGMKFIFKREAA